MTVGKHVAGPWTHLCAYRIDPDYGRTPQIVPVNGENPVAEITNDYNDETMWANARLIAAAPELLEALSILAAFPLDEFNAYDGAPRDRRIFGANDWNLCVGHVLAARAAIAKATGEA